jgi:hypothetical protein
MDDELLAPGATRGESSAEGLVRTCVHEADVCGVPTRFVLSAYTNRNLVLVTQTDGMGTLVRAARARLFEPPQRARENAYRQRTPHASLTLVSLPPRMPHHPPRARQIHAQADNPIDASSGSYSTRVLLGKRDDEVLEVYARTLVELIGKKCPKPNPLLLSISIKEHSQEAFREIMRHVMEHAVW